MSDEELAPDGESLDDAGADIAESAQDEATHVEGMTLDALVGYDDEIAHLREMGIIDRVDSEYLDFVEQMRRQHGLYDEPVGDAVLFRSDVREDADRLMVATANELDRPCVRMRLVEASGGAQALAIMAPPGMTDAGFDDWGTLLIEGIDTWGTPDGIDFGSSGLGLNLGAAGAARGALKALSFIRSAVANPKVAVFASACTLPDPLSPMMRFIGPMRVFDIPAPSAEERDAIWNHLMDKHVSISALDRFELVRLTAGMPRCDIFSVAREAVVQAYRQSLERMVYVPVSRGNLLDKIAGYLPLDSAEYREIEDSMVEDFRADIERYEHESL